MNRSIAYMMLDLSFTQSKIFKTDTKLLCTYSMQKYVTITSPINQVKSSTPLVDIAAMAEACLPDKTEI
jgi:hypothetical protein